MKAKSLNNALLASVKGNELQIVDCLLRAGADVNSSDNTNTTALMYAVLTHNLKLVEILAENGADANAVNNEGYTALIYAAKQGYLEIAEALIEDFGANSKIKDKEGNDAIWYSIKFGHNLQLTRFLREALDYGYNNVNLRNTKCSANTNSEQLKNIEKAILLTIHKDKTTILNELLHIDIKWNSSFLDDLQKCLEETSVSQQILNTLLLYSIDTKQDDIMKILSNIGFDINLADSKGNNTLLSEVKKGNISKIKALLQLGSDVNITDDKGKSALLYAIENNHIEIIQEILKYDVKQTIKNESLLLAIQKKQFDIVKQLLKLGASVNLSDKSKNTPLIEAISSGYIDIVQEILKYDIIQVNKDKALILATQKGQTKIVKKLLQLGANINAVCNDEGNALWYATNSEDIATIKELLKYKIKQSFKDSALFTAVQMQQVEITKLLLLSGANVNSFDYIQKHTLLWVASKSGNIKLVKELIKYNPIQFSINESFLIAVKQNNIEIANLLLNLSPDVNFKDGDEHTALWYAIMQNNAHIIKQILNFDLDVDTKNEIMLIASKCNMFELVLGLLKSGADVNAIDDTGYSVLLYAINNNSVVKEILKYNICQSIKNEALILTIKGKNGEIARKLLQLKASGNIIDKEGHTACWYAINNDMLDIAMSILISEINLCDNDNILFLSVQKGYFEIVKQLLQYGCNINTLDKDKKSPLEYAVSCNHIDIVNELLKYEINDDIKNRALRVAIITNNTEISKTLIKLGADINFYENNDNPSIWYAIRNGNMEIISEVLKHDISRPTKEYILISSAKQNQIDIAKVILQYTTKVNKTDQEGYTPLLYAIENGSIELIKEFLKYEITQTNKDNALVLAVKLFQKETVEQLLALGADFDKVDVNDQLIYGTTFNNISMVDAALQGVILQRTKDNALFLAVKRRNVDLIKILLENGANVNATTNLGFTPIRYIMRAPKKNHLDNTIIDILSNAGGVLGRKKPIKISQTKANQKKQKQKKQKKQKSSLRKEVLKSFKKPYT